MINTFNNKLENLYQKIFQYLDRLDIFAFAQIIEEFLLFVKCRVGMLIILDPNFLDFYAFD